MKIKIVPVLLILIAVLLAGILFMSLRSGGLFGGSQATISGKFDINGTIPDGSTITLTEQEVGSAKSTVFASGVPVADEEEWSFNNAVKNKTYQIQAQVVLNGKTVTESSPIEVTAPGDDEILTLNIESDGKRSAVISGSIVVNGYIPNGSTITIKGRRLGVTEFTTVASGLVGQARQFMSYTTAVAGTTYEVEGVLLNASGQQIGASSLLSVTAPAIDETLTINSSAQSPTVVVATPTAAPASATSAPTATPAPAPASSVVSGGINFNGAAPSNSRIVVFQKPLNGASYQVAVDNIAPIDGTSWQWNGAQPSTWYTMIAILKQRNANGTDTDIATSAPVTIAAPATNVIFTINSGVSLQGPGGPITVTCQSYNGGPNQNNWNVTVNFGTVSGAQSYWLQIGSTNGGNNLVNTTQNTQVGSNQTIGTTFNNNTTYYARYAYANIPNAGTGNSQYSGFSSTTPLQCSH
ncbi:MAG TPA: hypothetical protein VG917_05515 [Patescibacteria group bacterium]|nr:hypothetical protein [Patescibacteria group bacterium]